MSQPAPHVARRLVDPGVEAVLGAVRLVDHDDDVRSRGELRELIPLLRSELLDGREHHTPDLPVELDLQVLDAFDLDRILAQQIAAAPEGSEQLVVQIVAIGQDHQGRVLQLGQMHDAAGQKCHQERFAGALRVPDHTALAIKVPGRQDRPHRLTDGMKLMIAGGLLDRALAIILEHHEPAQHVQQNAAVQYPLVRVSRARPLVSGTMVSPSMVRQRMNRSSPADRVP